MTKYKKLILVFDLDDTLYKEIDFLKSAYLEIATYLSTKINEPATQLYEVLFLYYTQGQNAFESLLKHYAIKDVSTTELVEMYRRHYPNIVLPPAHRTLLSDIKTMIFKVGLITDGRSIQQRHKLEALGLLHYFDNIIISEEFGSEKPNLQNFLFFETTYGNDCHYIYVGDNLLKDFIAPNALGWTTIGLQDNGQNIHKHSQTVTLNHLPHHKISDLTHLQPLLLTIKKV